MLIACNPKLPVRSVGPDKDKPQSDAITALKKGMLLPGRDLVAEGVQADIEEDENNGIECVAWSTHPEDESVVVTAHKSGKVGSLVTLHAVEIHSLLVNSFGDRAQNRHGEQPRCSPLSRCKTFALTVGWRWRDACNFGEAGLRLGHGARDPNGQGYVGRPLRRSDGLRHLWRRGGDWRYASNSMGLVSAETVALLHCSRPLGMQARSALVTWGGGGLWLFY